MQKNEKLKILVCEADVRILSRLESWIIAIGEDVVTTADGIEAFEIVKKKSPDIILISKNIKNIGGIELIEKIRKTVPNQAIIFVTDDDVFLFKDAINLQVDRYLNFPVEAKPLFYAIESLSKEKLWHEDFRVQKGVLQDYKDAIELSFSVSRHDKDGNILYVNDLFCLTTKIRYVDAMKGVLNPLQNPNEDMSIVWDALKTDFLYKDRQVFKLKGKPERTIDVTAVALRDDKDEVYEYLVFSDDVSEIIHSQRKIKNQKLDNKIAKLEHVKELNRVKDSFLTIFTHELKTPLNSIINFSEYVKKHLSKENFKKRDKLVSQVQEINNSGIFMLDMIHNLMEAMKLKSTKISLDITEFKIKEVLDGVINEYNVKLGCKSITLICEDDIKILSDQNRFMQVMKNIIANAIKYSKFQIIINIIEKNDVFFVSVEDDGKGFSDTEHVFDIFEQSDANSMTREATGTGVGLYIVKQLCDRMHYNININTSVKLGGAKVSIEGNKKVS